MPDSVVSVSVANGWRWKAGGWDPRWELRLERIKVVTSHEGLP